MACVLPLCTITHGQLPATAPTGRSEAFLLHLPGVAGPKEIDASLVRGLQRGGVAGEVRVYDWTRNDPGFNALVQLKRNREEARKVAELIERTYRADPSRPIYVTAHSGGTGIAVWALENLPADVRVRSLVLLQSALSPGYDLTAALRRVDGRAYSLHSAGDEFVLGVGTRMFGTIDGLKSDAAGLVGFRPPATDEAREQYAKLTQVPYDPAWVQYRNAGDHIGPMHARFAAAVLAPMIVEGAVPAPTTRPAK